MRSEFRRPRTPQTQEFWHRLEAELRKAVESGSSKRRVPPSWRRFLRRIRPALHGGLVLSMVTILMVWGGTARFLGHRSSTTLAAPPGPVIELSDLDIAPPWMEPDPRAVFRSVRSVMPADPPPVLISQPLDIR